MGLFRKLMLGNKGLRYKLLIAFSLMSIIPLLACMYIISNYVFPQIDNLFMVSAVTMVSIVLAVLGLALARGLVDPVIDMAIEAKIIASGEYDRNLPVSSDDEIGTLAGSINMMTQKVKSNLDELKSYSQRMGEINVDIHKKVMALSSLLQIGDTISAHSIQIEPLLSLIVERSASVLDTGYGVFYVAAKDGSGIFKAGISYNLDTEKLTEVTIKKGGHEFLDRTLESRAILTIDKSAKPSKELESFRAAYNVKNFLIIPIYSGRNDLGLLLIGSRIEDLRFKDDDVELMKVFAKQATIAIESDMLSKKTDQLAIKDDLTDLYNKTFIMGRLEEEIRRAIFYQRPCSFVAFNIDNFRKFRDTHGELAAEEALKRMAKIFRDNLTPVGKAARIGGDDFAMLLPEKNKKEAAYIAEELRKKIETTNLLRQGQASLTVSCGVGENPIDGSTAEELYKKAMSAVKEAKSLGKNRVVV